MTAREIIDASVNHGRCVTLVSLNKERVKALVRRHYAVIREDGDCLYLNDEVWIKVTDGKGKREGIPNGLPPNVWHLFTSE